MKYDGYRDSRTAPTTTRGTSRPMFASVRAQEVRPERGGESGRGRGAEFGLGHRANPQKTKCLTPTDCERCGAQPWGGEAAEHNKRGGGEVGQGDRQRLRGRAQWHHRQRLRRGDEVRRRAEGSWTPAETRPREPELRGHGQGDCEDQRRELRRGQDLTMGPRHAW